MFDERSLRYHPTRTSAITQGHDRVDDQGQNFVMSDEARRRGVAGVRHMLATIRFINTHLKAFISVVPADAPALSARQADCAT